MQRVRKDMENWIKLRRFVCACVCVVVLVVVLVFWSGKTIVKCMQRG